MKVSKHNINVKIWRSFASMEEGYISKNMVITSNLPNAFSWATALHGICSWMDFHTNGKYNPVVKQCIFIGGKMSNMQGQWEMIHTGSRRQKYAMIFVQEHFLSRCSTLFGKIICLFNSAYTVIGNRSRDHFNAKSFVIGLTNSYIRKCKRDFNAVQESSEHGVLTLCMARTESIHCDGLTWFDFPKCNTLHLSTLNSISHSSTHAQLTNILL